MILYTGNEFLAFCKSNEFIRNIIRCFREVAHERSRKIKNDIRIRKGIQGEENLNISYRGNKSSVSHKLTGKLQDKIYI